jgi:hypothetical protein
MTKKNDIFSYDEILFEENDDEILEVLVRQEKHLGDSDNIPVYHQASVIGHISREKLKDISKNPIDFLVASTVPDRLRFDESEYKRIENVADKIMSHCTFKDLDNSRLNFYDIDRPAAKKFTDSLIDKQDHIEEPNKEELKNALEALDLGCIESIIPGFKGVAAFSFINTEQRSSEMSPEVRVVGEDSCSENSDSEEV